jgi:DUF4097 and DUF4098 domain-containing protein YvlB
MKYIFGFGIALLAALTVTAEGTGERVPVTLSDPSRPAMVIAEVISGSIHVKAYEGKEVIVEVRGGHERDRDREERRSDGLRRIPMNGAGFEVSEESNTVRVSTPPSNNSSDLDIQVPVRSSLRLKTINGGEITVDGVHGEFDLSNINGSITLTNVAGSAVAHALNGKIKAVFTSVSSDKPMSFSSMNGTIDVTFPSSLKANLKIKNQNGDVFSDYEMKISSTGQPQIEERRGEGGRYRVKLEKSILATVNGGGPEYQFSNFNGSILIRKGQ